MKYLLLSPSGIPILGDTLANTIFGSRAARLDAASRCVIVCNEPDSVTFGPDYSYDEMVREAAARAITLLRRRGYTLYTISE